MAYTRTYSGELTAYRGGGKNIYPRDDQSHYVVGCVGEGDYIDYLYGVLAKFDFSSIADNATVTKINASIRRIKGESNLTFSVSFYHSAPSTNVDEIARTGYTEVYAYRTAANFTGGANEEDSYSRTFSVNPSYFQNIRDNGFLLHGSWTQHRRMEIDAITLSVETNEDVFTLSYDANSGTDAPAKQTGVGVSTCAFTISDAVPVRKNYKFLGWSLSAGGTATYKAGDTVTASALYTILYAVWELDIGTLTFDSNTGTGDIPFITDTIGTSVTISELIPEKYGWTFVAWNTKQDGTGTDYKVGDKYTIATTEATLYAKFRENIRTLLYNANGGEGAPVAFTDVWSNPIPISNQIPFRQNHLFRGWATTPTATEPQYDIGDSYTGTEDVELFAVWKQAEYSVFVNDNGKWYSVSDVFTMDDEWKDKSIPFVNDENHRFKTTKL